MNFCHVGRVLAHNQGTLLPDVLGRHEFISSERWEGGEWVDLCSERSSSICGPEDKSQPLGNCSVGTGGINEGISEERERMSINFGEAGEVLQWLLHLTTHHVFGSSRLFCTI